MLSYLGLLEYYYKQKVIDRNFQIYSLNSILCGQGMNQVCRFKLSSTILNFSGGNLMCSTPLV